MVPRTSDIGVGLGQGRMDICIHLALPSDHEEGTSGALEYGRDDVGGGGCGDVGYVRMLEMWGCWRCRMWDMWGCGRCENVGDMGMLEMWDVGDAGMWEMYDIGDMGMLMMRQVAH